MSVCSIPISQEISVYDGHTMSAQAFALTIENANKMAKKYIIQGCNVTKPNSSTNNILHITSGWCVVQGRTVRVNETDITINVGYPSVNQTWYVVLTVDLTNAETPAYLVVVDSIPTDTENFNVSASGISSLLIASFTIGSSGIVADSINNKISDNNTSVRVKYEMYPESQAKRNAATSFVWVGPEKGVEVTDLEPGVYLCMADTQVSGYDNTIGMAKTTLYVNGTEHKGASSVSSRCSSIFMNAGIHANLQNTDLVRIPESGKVTIGVAIQTSKQYRVWDCVLVLIKLCNDVSFI